MTSRRKFLKKMAFSSGALLFTDVLNASHKSKDWDKENIKVVSTWNHGLAANEEAWKVLSVGGSALDAVEKGVSQTESDLNNLSVGLGGRTDHKGKVTLDACIMNHKHQCGAVAFLQHIDHPIQVARKVMENTPHVMLVGQGAYEFALRNGFKRSRVEVPSKKAKMLYEKWLEKQKKLQFETPVNIENHDTIGMLAIDAKQNLSGACTTSGLAYKLHGRVGDSPIIGAGLYVDNEVGAAVATGVGELVMRTAGTHAVVELMRQGKSPEEACREAVERIIKIEKNLKGKQVGFIALNKDGQHGTYSVHKGFSFATYYQNSNEMARSPFVME